MRRHRTIPGLAIVTGLLLLAAWPAAAKPGDEIAWMTEVEAAFKKAPAVLEIAFKRYWAEMEKYSERRTDQVGIKRSTFLKGRAR